MQKTLSLLLALCLLLGLLPAAAETAQEPASVLLPAAGDVIFGFEAKEIRDFPLIQAKLVLFEHQKTGSKLVYVANEDTNRVFQLSFATRPTDATGLPHVFEHSCLSGSEKYPGAQLFLNLSNQTYNTFMNAYTTDAMTCYPIASMSEKQLLRYADYYTDSCFHPLILENESIYRTEAWRYRLEKAEDPLTIEGTVYSEMLGVYTLNTDAMIKAYQTAFPGSVLGYYYGGDPDHIPEMTWEALKDYHAMYYHPSNCVAWLYGKLEDYTAFLALLDAEYSGYEKSDFVFRDTGYTRLTGPVEAQFGYPMPEGTDPANQSVVTYYVICPGMRESAGEEEVMDNLLLLLGMPSSVLSLNLKKEFPAAVFSCGRELAAEDDGICFTVNNVNPEDAPRIREIIDAALQDVAANGFPRDLVDAATSSISLSTRLAPESADPVLGVLSSLSYHCAVTGDPFDYLSSVASTDFLSAWSEQGLYQASAEKWLKDNPLTALVTVYPEPGKKEEKDAALAAKLAEIKAGMSEEEIRTLVESAGAGPEEEDLRDQIASLQAETVDSLPEEIRLYDISDVAGADDVRRIDAEAGVDGVGSPLVYLDAAAVPQEDLHWLRLFASLQGRLDTDRHTADELKTLISRYLYQKEISVSTGGYGDDFHPYLKITWTAMDADLGAGYDLVREMLTGTVYGDPAKLLEQVKAEKAAVRNALNSSPYTLILYRSLATDNAMARYYTYMNHLEYYSFLGETEKALESGSEEPGQCLARIQAFMANGSGAVLGFAGNKTSIALNRPLADAFLAALGSEPREPQAWDLPVPARREAIIVDSNVQYNGVFASGAALGLKGMDAGLGVVTSLITDSVLYPRLRDGYGVYDVIHSIDLLGFKLISYRDPNVQETFDVYAGLADSLEQMDITQEILDGYILSSYSSYAKPAGELAGAVKAVDSLVNGLDPNRNLTYMKQLKAITPERVREAAAMYRMVLESGTRFSAGGAGALQANAELFDVVLNPFNAVDASAVSFEDIIEGGEYDYDTMREAYENRLMLPLGETVFGVAEDATVGDLLGGIYAMIGGSAEDQDAARDALAGYQLVDADLDPREKLTEEKLCAIVNGAFGPILSTDTPDRVPPRGEIADLLVQIFRQLQQ